MQADSLRDGCQAQTLQASLHNEAGIPGYTD